ncbi:UDP-N-acetylglucosamine diphosphorylase/glucosamine-1-phosphate N-acetyltransferase [Halobacteroides halobius DSM 5150]|uniref:Bifunctional protein GlmU n=1 Tax=Halobacteroides halobius (strain ATCC 35273 / DSM 5150 / MD-1) TaxID=748449 RepID=L0K7L7_HALHC|nr:bifunctional UDP-N-acetylglucosamine diphosphorylase/glucosamine-1-phosphate N-acetyltransferase GlmU [Halobacteroides halobius]AGB40118.1 UDP-N-acetylglucosamine diphosphorylase/glucosamine-1-phosphate N-acetyltransferase [Halobacteroides halobius DSM 5150]
MSELAIITLAAGKGTRMKSDLPKVLHKVAGKSMVQHAVDTADKLNPIHNIVVVGYKSNQVEAKTKGDLQFVMQEEQLGTGHAVMQTEDRLSDFEGTVLVMYGDTPLLTANTLDELVTKHQQEDAAATILTAKIDDPSGYGRIVRNQSGQVVKIVEDKDTTVDEAKIKEINTGICCFDSQLLWEALEEITPNNEQGEYYLTDVAGVLAKQEKNVTAVVAKDREETVGVNTKVHLAKAESILRTRVCNKHLQQGVTIIDPQNTYIDSGVEIGRDSIIYPFTFLEGDTKIGEEVIVGPRNRIKDSIIGNRVEIEASTVVDSQIGAGTVIGPYAYLRPGTKVGRDAKIGDFVEVKQSEIGDKTKVPHLSYIGDTTIGEKTNVGAGSITANYDGQDKHKTVIGDNTFIGSDTTLVAPIRVGDNAATGAGAVVTKDVETDQTVIGVPAKPKDDN